MEWVQSLALEFLHVGKKKKKKGQEREKMPNIKQTVEKQLPEARAAEEDRE